MNQNEKNLLSLPFVLPIHGLTEKEIARNKMIDILTRSEQSENPVLKKAFDYLFNLVEKSKARSISRPKQGPLLMGVEADTSPEGEFELRFVTFDKKVTQATHPLDLVFPFVHEINHLQSTEEFDNSLPQSLSVEERLSAHWQRTSDPHEYLKMEAVGNAVMCEMAIYFFGQTGILLNAPEQYIEMTSRYIQVGMDPSCEAWQNYTSELQQLGITSKFEI